MQALTIADIGAMIQAGLGTPGTSVRQCSGVRGALALLLALEVSTMPIIQSLLDTDFYKFTMGHWVFKRYSNVPVRYAFKNRTARVRLAEYIDEAELRRERSRAHVARESQ